MSYTKSDALVKLKPGAKWIWNGDNYSDLQWLDEDQTKPTEEEINIKLSQLPIEAQQEKEAKEARIASAKAKLEALGLTTEEIKDTFKL